MFQIISTPSDRHFLAYSTLEIGINRKSMVIGWWGDGIKGCSDGWRVWVVMFIGVEDELVGLLGVGDGRELKCRWSAISFYII